MICQKCDVALVAMGYGDEQCPECGHVEYSESEEDFNSRIGYTTGREDKKQATRIKNEQREN